MYIPSIDDNMDGCKDQVHVCAHMYRVDATVFRVKIKNLKTNRKS